MDNELLKTLLGLGSVGLVVGIIQALKPIVTNEKWYGLIAIVIGVGLNIAIVWGMGLLTKNMIIVAAISGLMAGLAANGAYSTGQIQANKVVVDKDKLIAEGVVPTEVK
jgi:hypothetical protein